MKKRQVILLMTLALAFGAAAGTDCQALVIEKKAEEETLDSQELEDGVYLAEFETDSSMFHVNDAKEGKGDLTVKEGKMTIHISLVSENIVNLYLGTAEDAEEDEENWLKPTEDTVMYSDGSTEVVYGFDVPVEEIGQEFDLAILGTKGTWYDHKVSVSHVTLPEQE